MYGAYFYILEGKSAIILYKFDSGDVKKVPEQDKYTYNVYANKILFEHNTKGRYAPRSFNLTPRQLEMWSANNFSELSREVIPNIFNPSVAKRL